MWDAQRAECETIGEEKVDETYRQTLEVRVVLVSFMSRNRSRRNSLRSSDADWDAMTMWWTVRKQMSDSGFQAEGNKREKLLRGFINARPTTKLGRDLKFGTLRPCMSRPS